MPEMTTSIRWTVLLQFFGAKTAPNRWAWKRWDERFRTIGLVTMNCALFQLTFSLIAYANGNLSLHLLDACDVRHSYSSLVFWYLFFFGVVSIDILFEGENENVVRYSRQCCYCCYYCCWSRKISFISYWYSDFILRGHPPAREKRFSRNDAHTKRPRHKGYLQTISIDRKHWKSIWREKTISFQKCSRRRRHWWTRWSDIDFYGKVSSLCRCHSCNLSKPFFLQLKHTIFVRRPHLPANSLTPGFFDRKEKSFGNKVSRWFLGACLSQTTGKIKPPSSLLHWFRPNWMRVFRYWSFIWKIWPSWYYWNGWSPSKDDWIKFIDSMSSVWLLFPSAWIDSLSVCVSGLSMQLFRGHRATGQRSHIITSEGKRSVAFDPWLVTAIEAKEKEPTRRKHSRRTTTSRRKKKDLTRL